MPVIGRSSALVILAIMVALAGGWLHRYFRNVEQAEDAARTVTDFHGQAYSAAGFKTVLHGFDPDDIIMRPYDWLRPDQIARIDAVYREKAIGAGYLAPDGRDLGTVEQAYACQPILSFALKSGSPPGPDPIQAVDGIGADAYFGSQFLTEIENFAASAADPILRTCAKVYLEAGFLDSYGIE
ncbi:hypothetical protein JL100_022305 [Skermanella mucosa]|uniref:hypothetical protein n=1 Tax=Skermanella mucosa TaxID=1789672 RepID=UPI00192B5846|nr:hypothetical protein [Skermanella mucosa]UEM19793.1 hypothetical protein JL100_022305 [Skermanella mucosa]